MSSVIREGLGSYSFRRDRSNFQLFTERSKVGNLRHRRSASLTGGKSQSKDQQLQVCMLTGIVMAETALQLESTGEGLLTSDLG